MKKILFFSLGLSLALAPITRAEDNPPPKKTVHARAVASARTSHPAIASRVSTRRIAASRVPTAHPIRGVRTEVGAFHPHTVPTYHNAFAVNHPFNRNSYAIAQSRVIRVQHDRAWWVSHYHTRFVLFGGGYYYWNAGYWYPAFGYSPFYNTYAYAQPIYGYDNLPPGQVLENVQSALSNQGYYQGPIDGLVGPQTQAALASFQQDHGLAVTSAVDEPTLVTLGLA